jgi:hypothetical protein
VNRWGFIVGSFTEQDVEDIFWAQATIDSGRILAGGKSLIADLFSCGVGGSRQLSSAASLAAASVTHPTRLATCSLYIKYFMLSL